MSELTHINCVALTARFPVGKPVVPAALMNRPTRGERRFAYWALAECILAYYVGTDEGVSEVLHVAEKKGCTGASAEYVIQDIFRFLAH
jgi:hypothetical protein